MGGAARFQIAHWAPSKSIKMYVKMCICRHDSDRNKTFQAIKRVSSWTGNGVVRWSRCTVEDRKLKFLKVKPSSAV